MKQEIRQKVYEKYGGKEKVSGKESEIGGDRGITLDEAIKHCIKTAERKEKEGCRSCANEHRQLGDWLSELVLLREKQVPKKIQISDDGWEYYCPVCHTKHFVKNVATYCFRCGQKLDWSDEE